MITWKPAPEAEWEHRQQPAVWDAQFTPDIHWGNTMRPRKARRVNRFLMLVAFGWLIAAGLAVAL